MRARGKVYKLKCPCGVLLSHTLPASSSLGLLATLGFSGACSCSAKREWPALHLILRHVLLQLLRLLHAVLQVPVWSRTQPHPACLLPAASSSVCWRLLAFPEHAHARRSESGPLFASFFAMSCCSSSASSMSFSKCQCGLLLSHTLHACFLLPPPPRSAGDSGWLFRSMHMLGKARVARSSPHSSPCPAAAPPPSCSFFMQLLLLHVAMSGWLCFKHKHQETDGMFF